MGDSHDKHQAHHNLVARLRQEAADVERLASGLDDATMARRVIEGKWSLHELVCHLWRVQDVFEGRVDAMLTQDNPAITVYDPDNDTEFGKVTAQPASQALSGFLAARSRFAERLEKLTPAEWHRQGRHPEYPSYDVHFQMEYMAHHEAHHIYQMYQRRAALGKIPHG